jgi:hypothetical protein
MNRRITTQDISWFLDLHSRAQLDLDPPYQRRSVWTPRDRKFFLDTIFRDYPCPAIFLHKTISDQGKTTFHVVDGKQRLETIIAFAEGKLSIGDDFGDARYSRKRWKDLGDEQKRLFWNYVLTVENLDSVEGLVVNAVFDRLNRNSRKLTRQELRHSRGDGWFANEVEAEVEKEEWRRIGLITTARARRMSDAQFMSELMQVVIEGKIIGFDQDTLDELYTDYDEPQLTKPLFSEQEFRTRFEAAKRYVLALQDANRVIEHHATGFANFYSLWTLVVLEAQSLPTAAEFACRYDSFMAKVAELSAVEDLEQYIAKRGDNTADLREPLNYYTNAQSATTDLGAREGRHAALKKALLDDDEISSGT